MTYAIAYAIAYAINKEFILSFHFLSPLFYKPFASSTFLPQKTQALYVLSAYTP